MTNIRYVNPGRQITNQETVYIFIIKMSESLEQRKENVARMSTSWAAICLTNLWLNGL
jgi:hypothetical protein